MSAYETTDENGLTNLTCTLEGVSCAGCISKIERNLKQIDGVIVARGNATSKRIQLVWDNTATNSSTLINAIASLGYGAHPFDMRTLSNERPSLLAPLAVAGFAMMNIMAFSAAAWLGIATDMSASSMQLMHLYSALLATPVVFYCGAVFYAPALQALRHGNMTMDTPIAIAIFVTYAASLFEAYRGSHDVYFDAVVALVFFLLIGRVLDQKLRKKSGQTADNLRAMLNVTARRSNPDGTEVQIAADLLVPGDVISLERDDVIPADGKIVRGPIYVDESALTGESLPVSKKTGDMVAAGCRVIEGSSRVQVIQAGNHAQLGQLAELAENATLHKGQTQLMADRFARSYVPIVLIGGTLGFLIWYVLLNAPFADSLMISVAVLVVTCPCAAGLATPAVSARAVDLLISKGIVLRSGAALETLAKVTRVFLDKTGTLTTANLIIDGPSKVLQEAGPLAAASRHPLARALSELHPAAPLCDTNEVIGKGISAPNGAALGSAEFINVEQGDDETSLWFRSPSGSITRFRVLEETRQGVQDLIEGLKNRNLNIALLSGDRQTPVRKFADSLNIPEWHAELKPEEKFAVLQKANEVTLMFGDGINDAPALSLASVSASHASATQIAQASADVILLRPDPAHLITAIDLSRNASRLISQNLYFATIYNIVTVPLALAGFLSPFLAAILMSSSSIIVLANGLRLKVST